jgi:DNA-binding response OmpR family regulator
VADGRNEPAAVLIVDDDEGFRALVRDVLERAGFATEEADCGKSAVSSALTRRPALVLLDVALPSLSGYEVCRRLRERYGAGLPIIFLSGDRTEVHDRVAGLQLGGDDYMTKPFVEDELIARVQAVLRRAATPPPRGTLTNREQQVIEFLAAGLSQKQIAADLEISASTVGSHIEHILAKFDVHSRTEAVGFAYRNGIIKTAA